MLKPGIFLFAAAVLLLVLTAAIFFAYTAAFQNRKKAMVEKINGYMGQPKKVTVIFVDITYSDSGKSYTGQPFRRQFINAVNTSLTSSADVVAAYLIHGKTRDEQPFWTNRPLSSPAPNNSTGAAAITKGDLQKKLCIEAFDSVVVAVSPSKRSPLDSILTGFTDIFGAFQQAAIYFRRYTTTPGDVKRIFLLSDGKENAGSISGSIKLNNLGSLDTARMLAEAAVSQLQNTTDIKEELVHADIYMLSPNERLFYNEERNLRRVFWEALLIGKFNCSSLHYF